MNLSIIIPTYNSAKYLKNCLDSIINNINKNTPIEIIIVNDGSTDNTKEIINSYNDQKIKVYNNKNHGVSYSRNYAMKKAIGKYIMFVDSDDILNNDWYSIVSEQLTKEYDIVFFSQNLTIKDKPELINLIIGKNTKASISGPCSKIYKKEFLQKNNLEFNTSIINGEDMLFNLASLLKANTTNIISKSFYKYRIASGSSTKKFNEKIFNSDKLFHEQLSTILKNNKDLNNMQKSEIKDYCLQKAIFMLATRISYIQKYKDARKYFKYIEDYLYYNTLIRLIKQKTKITQKIILKALINKKYYIVYYIYKLHNKIKYRKSKEYFKTI